jgi:hypothetical protein
LTSFLCFEVEKLRSKRHQLDDYCVAFWMILSGRVELVCSEKKFIALTDFLLVDDSTSLA